MSYKDDFELATGWSAIDISIRLNNKDKGFLDYLTKNHVSTIIRYYASDTANAKTLTNEEAKFLSAQGFMILPVFQDSGRKIEHFSTATGTSNAKSAVAFAQAIGQPKNAGSTIIFAVDQDYKTAEINGAILDYFRAVHQTVGQAFTLGAYGSGAVLSTLLAEGLISVPWLSMSRGFLGTQSFFYDNKWALRQLPPEQKYSATLDFDRDILRLTPSQLGAFTVDENGVGHVA